MKLRDLLERDCNVDRSSSLASEAIAAALTAALALSACGPKAVSSGIATPSETSQGYKAEGPSQEIRVLYGEHLKARQTRPDEIENVQALLQRDISRARRLTELYESGSIKSVSDKYRSAKILRDAPPEYPPTDEDVKFKEYAVELAYNAMREIHLTVTSGNDNPEISYMDAITSFAKSFDRLLIARGSESQRFGTIYTAEMGAEGKIIINDKGEVNWILIPPVNPDFTREEYAKYGQILYVVSREISHLDLKP